MVPEQLCGPRVRILLDRASLLYQGAEEMNSKYDPERYIGIDVSKAELDIAVGQEGETWQAKNATKAIRACVRRIKNMHPELVVLESTGGLEKQMINILQEEEIPVALVHPGRVRDFAKGIGQFAKNDRIDARLLAYYGFAARPFPKPKKKPVVEELSALIRRRNQMIEMLTAERNRKHTCPESQKQSLEEHIDWLSERRDELTEQIEVMLSEEPEFEEKNVILQSVKCVGPILSATLQAELPELGSYSHKQIAALVGVAPYSKDSGRSKKKRSTRGGRSIVRNTLYMATMSATRHNPVIRAHYDQLIGRGKPCNVAIVACMRKFLVILNAMIRDMCLWNSNLSQPAH